jgi:hypothetical protein
MIKKQLTPKAKELLDEITSDLFSHVPDKEERESLMNKPTTFRTIIWNLFISEKYTPKLSGAIYNEIFDYLMGKYSNIDEVSSDMEFLAHKLKMQSNKTLELVENYKTKYKK